MDAHFVLVRGESLPLPGALERQFYLRVSLLRPAGRFTSGKVSHIWNSIFWNRITWLQDPSTMATTFKWAPWDWVLKKKNLGALQLPLKVEALVQKLLISAAELDLNTGFLNLPIYHTYETRLLAQSHSLVLPDLGCYILGNWNSYLQLLNR